MIDRDGGFPLSEEAIFQLSRPGIEICWSKPRDFFFLAYHQPLFLDNLPWFKYVFLVNPPCGESMAREYVVNLNLIASVHMFPRNLGNI